MPNTSVAYKPRKKKTKGPKKTSEPKKTASKSRSRSRSKSRSRSGSKGPKTKYYKLDKGEVSHLKAYDVRTKKWGAFKPIDDWTLHSVTSAKRPDIKLYRATDGKHTIFIGKDVYEKMPKDKLVK
jgi:hypothetical protein